jgi:NAD+ kinase
VKIEVHPSYAGFEVQIDGHAYPLDEVEYELTMHENKVTLVSLDQLGLGIQGLRKRGLITDSPRVLARDARTRHES